MIETLGRATYTGHATDCHRCFGMRHPSSCPGCITLSEEWERLVTRLQSLLDREIEKAGG
jgi:hypothetical protein